MTPTNPTENTLQVGEGQAATPAASQPAGAGASQGTDPVLERLNAFEKRLQASEGVARSKQSEADKVISATRKDFKKEIEPIVESARRSLNLDDAQAAAYRNQLIQDEMQRRVFDGESNSPAAPALPGSGTGSAAQIGEWDVLQESKLNAEDPDVAQAIVDAGGNAVKLAMALGKIQAKRENQSPPNLALNAGLVNGSGVTAPNQAELKAGYTNELQAARGNRELVKSIQAKYQAQGLDTGNIVISI